MYRGLVRADVPFMSVPIVSLNRETSISEPEQVIFVFRNRQVIYSCKKEKIQTSKMNISENFIVR